MKFRFVSLTEAARSVQVHQSLTRENALEQAATLLEAGLSFSDTETILRNHLKTLRRQHDGCYVYNWLRAAYDDFFVYEVCGADDIDRLFQATYSIDDSGNLTVGEPIEVRAQVSYIPVAQAVTEALRVEFVGSFKEGAIAEDGTVLIKVIDPGIGSSGYYSAECLKAAAEAGVFKAGTHMFANHMTEEERRKRPVGDVLNLVAVLKEDGYWLDDGPSGPGVYALADVKKHFVNIIESLAKDIGVSIDANVTYVMGEIEGRVMPIVEQIVSLNSVDFVTRAGRGGEIITLQEAALSLYPTDKAPTPSTKHSLPSPANDNTTPTTKEGTENMDKTPEQLAQEARTQAVQLVRTATTVATEALAGLNLPQAAKARISEAALANLPITADNNLDTEAFTKAVKDAAASEALYAQQAYGFGDGKVNLPPAGEAGAAESAAPKAGAAELQDFLSTVL